MRWQADVYKQMGVTYDNFIELGLTPETMLLFGFTLTNWELLGFSKKHCQHVNDAVLYKLFNLSKPQLMAVLKH
jgi:hypothetical protein